MVSGVIPTTQRKLENNSQKKVLAGAKLSREVMKRSWIMINEVKVNWWLIVYFNWPVKIDSAHTAIHLLLWAWIEFLHTSPPSYTPHIPFPSPHTHYTIWQCPWNCLLNVYTYIHTYIRTSHNTMYIHTHTYFLSHCCLSSIMCIRGARSSIHRFERQLASAVDSTIPRVQTCHLIVFVLCSLFHCLCSIILCIPAYLHKLQTCVWWEISL